MNIGEIEHIIEVNKTGKDLYSLYKVQVDQFKVPFVLTKDIENYLANILNGNNQLEIVAALFLLSKFKKEETFDFESISKHLRKRDYQIGLQSIFAYNNSNSLKAEQHLIKYIINPKSDSFGQDAVDVLAKIISSKTTLIELIKNVALIKGQTQSAVKNLIYRLSFDSKYTEMNEVVDFLISNRMMPNEKYCFRGWKKSTSDKILENIIKRVNKIQSNPPNKSNTSVKFFTIESEYYYSMYRIVLDHNPSTFIKIQFGLHPLVSHSWGIQHIQFGLRYTEEMEFKTISEFNTSIDELIKKWKSKMAEEIDILENSTLDVIQRKSRIFKNNEKLNVHSYGGYINWLAFGKKKEEILLTGQRALNDKELNLNETWIEYFNNLDKITVTNML